MDTFLQDRRKIYSHPIQVEYYDDDHEMGKSERLAGKIAY